MSRMVLLIVLSLPCFGQKLDFGVKGGIPVTDAFQTTGSYFNMSVGWSASSATRRYTVGGMVELRLPHGFGVECDGLHKRLGFANVTKTGGAIYTYANASANSWEFPLLAKYRLPAIPAIHPYVDAGPSFRTLSGVSVSTTIITEFPGVPAAGPFHSSSDPPISRTARMPESRLDWGWTFASGAFTSPRRHATPAGDRTGNRIHTCIPLRIRSSFSWESPSEPLLPGRRARPQLAFHVGDHLFGGAGGAAKGALLGFVKLGVDDAALLRRVLVIGTGQSGNDGDHAAVDLELQPVAPLDAGPPLDAGRHGQAGLALHGDGHGETRLPTLPLA